MQNIDVDGNLKGKKVIIRANRHNLRHVDILGTIESNPKHWTKVMVKYFDPEIEEIVSRDFVSTHLESPTAESCRKLAHHYKRLALEFNELYKKLSEK